MTDGLIIVNDEDTIRMVNNAMCKMLAMVKDELIGRPLDAILADSPPTRHVRQNVVFHLPVRRMHQRYPGIAQGVQPAHGAGLPVRIDAQGRQ